MKKEQLSYKQEFVGDKSMTFQLQKDTISLVGSVLESELLAILQELVLIGSQEDFMDLLQKILSLYSQFYLMAKWLLLIGRINTEILCGDSWVVEVVNLHWFYNSLFVFLNLLLKDFQLIIFTTLLLKEKLKRKNMHQS